MSLEEYLEGLGSDDDEEMEEEEELEVEEVKEDKRYEKKNLFFL